MDMKRFLLLFFLMPLGVLYVQGQVGVWALDSIVMKDLNKSEGAKSVSKENIAPELFFDCPMEFEIQSDQVSVKLIDGKIFNNITYYLDNDNLIVSILPSKKSTYKIKVEQDLIILNQKMEFVEYTYLYKSKK